MRMLGSWLARVRGLFAPARGDRELSEEIENHLQLLRERFIRQGMSPTDADSAARRQFGNVLLLRERYGAQRSFLLLTEWLGDLRLAVRMAGLKCAPEIDPNIRINVTSAAPVAIVFASPEGQLPRFRRPNARP